MNEIIEKLNEIENTINNNSLFIEYENQKNEILHCPDLLDLKDYLTKEENIYTKEYQDVKTKYLKDERVANYMYLERQIYILTLEINKRLKKLIKGDEIWELLVVNTKEEI